MSDIMRRLDYIKGRAEEIQSFGVGLPEVGDLDTAKQVRELEYLVAYLAAIVSKHLETGER